MAILLPLPRRSLPDLDDDVDAGEQQRIDLLIQNEAIPSVRQKNLSSLQSWESIRETCYPIHVHVDHVVSPVVEENLVLEHPLPFFDDITWDAAIDDLDDITEYVELVNEIEEIGIKSLEKSKIPVENLYFEHLSADEQFLLSTLFESSDYALVITYKQKIKAVYNAL